MTPMSAADRRDRSGVARRRQPVVDRGPDFPALDRRIARPVVPRDQEYDALAPGDGSLQPAVDRGPGAVEIVAVQIEHSIRLGRAGTKAPVPARVERRSKLGRRAQRLRFFRTPDPRDDRTQNLFGFIFVFSWL